MRKSEYICPECGGNLYFIRSIRPKNSYICGRCEIVISSYDIELHKEYKAILSRRGFAEDHSIHKYSYLILLQNSILNTCEKSDEKYCPICKSKTMYKTWDGRYICAYCLFTIKSWKRKVPNEIRNKVLEMKKDGYSLNQISYNLTLSLPSVRAMLYKQRRVSK